MEKETIVKEKKSGTTPMTQSIDSAILDQFNAAYTKVVEHAKKNNLDKPNKGDFLSKIMKDGLVALGGKPEKFFKEVTIVTTKSKKYKYN